MKNSQQRLQLSLLQYQVQPNSQGLKCFTHPYLLLATLLGKPHHQGQVLKEQEDCTNASIVKRRENG
jgi:hypothetical protein